jgi:hypothetical protein
LNDAVIDCAQLRGLTVLLALLEALGGVHEQLPIVVSGCSPDCFTKLSTKIMLFVVK